MADHRATSATETEQLWYQFLAEGNSRADRARAVFRILPKDPRCKSCLGPFEGIGGRIMKMVGKGRSRINPKFCEACFRFGERHPGGAYVDLGMVFADVRGSTALAERIGDREFRGLINRFFQVSANALIDSGAIVDRLAGDEAIGFFVPGLAGPHYARRTLESARNLLLATGHGSQGDPWIPVGVGAHFGNAFVGMVGSPEGVLDFTALGDDVNAGARIASAAGPGELLASLELCRQARVDAHGFEQRELSLKGKRATMQVAAVPLGAGGLA